jgi:hypothetical protein
VQGFAGQSDAGLCWARPMLVFAWLGLCWFRSEWSCTGQHILDCSCARSPLKLVVFLAMMDWCCLVLRRTGLFFISMLD